MHLVLQPFRVLWKAYFMVVFVLTFVLLYPFFRILLARSSRFPQAFKLIRFYSWLLRFFSGMAVVVKRKPQLPQSSYIICANHSSYLDIIFMYGVFSDYFVFMGKSEIKKWPLFHIFFTKGMNISVDRGSRVDARKAMKRCGKELEKGHNVVIFPEATIPQDAPTLKRFKNGAFKLAIDTGTPIVPVTFLNNFKRLQVGAVLKVLGGPGTSKAIIHDPIETNGLTEEDLVDLRQQVFDTINGPLETLYGSK